MTDFSNYQVDFRNLRPCTQAVLFARVSKREQEQGASHDAQLEATRRYCLAKGLKVLEEFKITESSTRGSRKEFYNMLDIVKKQQNKTAIVVHCIDRFQRSFKESAEIENLLRDDIIELHFYKEGLVLTKNSSSADIMRWDMGILSAKMYVGNLRDNVRRSMEYNWLHGKLQGGSPTGYLNVRNKENKADVIIDPERGPLIKKMFEEYATGLYSLQDMVKWAKTHNLTSRGSARFPSKPLCRVAIYQILQNPFYYGVMRVKGNCLPHIYERLIDKDLFDRVQRVLSGSNKINTKTEYGSMEFALRGIFKCAKCGCAMSAELHTKKSGREYIYLRCSHMRGNCDQKPINEKEVFKQLEQNVIGSFKISDSALSAIKTEVRKELAKQAGSDLEAKKQIQLRIANAQTRLDNAVDLLLDRKLSEDIYQKKKASLDAEIAELQSELGKYSNSDNKIAEIVENIVDIAGNVGKVLKSSNVQQKRAILKLILSNSTIEGKRACIYLKKPFDLLLKSNGRSFWLGRTDSNHDKENQNLLSYH